jgi:hypothetical protein
LHLQDAAGFPGPIHAEILLGPPLQVYFVLRSQNVEKRPLIGLLHHQLYLFLTPLARKDH